MWKHIQKLQNKIHVLFFFWYRVWKFPAHLFHPNQLRQKRLNVYMQKMCKQAVGVLILHNLIWIFCSSAVFFLLVHKFFMYLSVSYLLHPHRLWIIHLRSSYFCLWFQSNIFFFMIVFPNLSVSIFR